MVLEPPQQEASILVLLAKIGRAHAADVVGGFETEVSEQPVELLISIYCFGYGGGI